jgi:hypothetical protein
MSQHESNFVVVHAAQMELLFMERSSVQEAGAKFKLCSMEECSNIVIMMSEDFVVVATFV